MYKEQNQASGIKLSDFHIKFIKFAPFNPEDTQKHEQIKIVQQSSGNTSSKWQ